MIQLTLTLKLTTAQVVETSVTDNNNSPIQDYVQPDDHTHPTFEMTPGFNPFYFPYYRVARNFCGTLLLRINDFLYFAGTNFCDSQKLPRIENIFVFIEYLQ